MNSLKRYREEVLISKAELARKAGVSVLTIDRIEKGKSCRLETKRKIILALDLKLSETHKLFGNEDQIGKALRASVDPTSNPKWVDEPKGMVFESESLV